MYCSEAAWARYTTFSTLLEMSFSFHMLELEFYGLSFGLTATVDSVVTNVNVKISGSSGYLRDNISTALDTTMRCAIIKA